MTEKPEKSQVPYQPPKGTAADYNHITHVIAVLSGKGGVGKSLVTGLLASGLRRKGLKVGILDADITGPSIPMLFGLHGTVDSGEFGIVPYKSRTGIKVISMNLLLTNEDQPVIWRGPLVSRAIQQLWGDVMWGDLDVLLIDLPPGTSDATLTIMQSLPVKGLVMVTTPQSLASMVVRKTVHMAQKVNVNIFGIIENMAYYLCPDTGKKHFIFGESHTGKIALTANAPILAQVPVDPAISSLCDSGNVEAIQFEGLDELIHAFVTASGIKVIEIEDEQYGVGHSDKSLDEGPSQPPIRNELGENILIKYSPVAREIIKNKENFGSFENPDLKGKVRGCCGDSIMMMVLMDGDRIKDARFTTDGCEATIAVGGMLTRLIIGMTLSEASEIEPKTLINELGGLPSAHVHCADLAIKTLRATLKDQGFIDEFSKLKDRKVDQK